MLIVVGYDMAENVGYYILFSAFQLIDMVFRKGADFASNHCASEYIRLVCDKKK